MSRSRVKPASALCADMRSPKTRSSERKLSSTPKQKWRTTKSPNPSRACWSRLSQKGEASGWLDASVEDLPAKRIKPDGLIAGMGKGKARANDDDAENDEVDIEDVLPSTKMKRIDELIDYWREVDPTQKMISVTEIELQGTYSLLSSSPP